MLKFTREQKIYLFSIFLAIEKGECFTPDAMGLLDIKERTKKCKTIPYHLKEE